MRTSQEQLISLSPVRAVTAKTRKLLQQFPTCITSHPDIYPMDDCNVAIDFRTDGMRGRTRVDDALQMIWEGAASKLRRVRIR